MAEGKFELPNKKVLVKYNPYNPGPIKNPKHIAYIKMEGCYDSYGVAMARNGKIKNPFTKEEKEYLEELLASNYGENCLSVYNKDSYLKIYDETPIRLGKDALPLDLSDPHDYISYKVLLTNSEVICKDITELKNKKTYKYYIEDEESVAKVKSDSGTKQMRAWKAYGKMEEDRNKLVSFLKVYSQFNGQPFGSLKVNESSKLKLIQAKVTDIISSDIERFLGIIENENYDIITLIAEAIEVGEIEKKGTKYFLKGGIDQIGRDLPDAIQYLKSSVNQELRIMLETVIKK